MAETWGFPIALDLFFAGLAAGAFCLSVLAARKKGEGFEVLSQAGAFLAPASIVFGFAMLTLDLMSRERFWYTLSVFNVASPMSMGVWLLTFFALILVAYAFCRVPGPVLARIPVAGRAAVRQRAACLRVLGPAGVPVALAVSVYTGVLLSVSSLPLWRNGALPALFCFSALATGFAGGALAALRTGAPEAMERPLSWLRLACRVLLSFYLVFALLFTVLTFLNTPRGDLCCLVAGWTGALWWAGVVGLGILLPLALMADGKRPGRRRLAAAFWLVLAGGFLLRLVIVFAGQAQV
jgi:formate-dependent nitrite reductase membrane component NrfD